MSDTRSTVECPECGASHHELMRQNTWACQGSVADLCMRRVCQNCVVRCGGCGLPACEKHRQSLGIGWDRLPWCDTCRKVAEDEAAIEQAQEKRS